MTNYWVIDFSEMGLNNWAVLTGRHRLTRMDRGKFTVFQFQWEDKTFWFTYYNIWSKRIRFPDYPDVLAAFPEFHAYKKIINIPNSPSTFNGDFIDEFQKAYEDDVTFVRLAFAGDPQEPFVTPRKNLRIVSSSLINHQSEQDYHKDFGLALVWFYLINHVSLVDPEKLEQMISSMPVTDKVFLLGRRITDEDQKGNSARSFYAQHMFQHLSPERYEMKSVLKPHIDFTGAHRNSTNTGLLLDYNSYYFNVIMESWDPNISADTFTEKTLTFAALSGPSFLVVNDTQLEFLHSIQIRPLNDFFPGDNLYEKFCAFCSFLENSTSEQRLTFYRQQCIIQKENRKLFWEYANSIKTQALNYILEGS